MGASRTYPLARRDELHTTTDEAPSGPSYRIIRRASSKRFLHDDFDILDPVMGPMSLRVGSYLPFAWGCYMNGHSYLAQELRKRNVWFRKQDHAIVGGADPSMWQQIADGLDEKTLRERADSWA